MISSVFGKTKPLNLLLFVTVLFAAMLWYFFHLSGTGTVDTTWDTALRCFFLSLFTLFIAEFINRKNLLTKNNHYLLLTLLSFWLSFPLILFHEGMMVSNILVLLAFRRLISLRSGQQVGLKIYDATLWIGFSALLFHWNILFLILVYMAVFLYSQQYYKHLLIPLVALGTVAILYLCYELYLGDGTAWWQGWELTLEFYTDKYQNPSYLLPSITFGILGACGIFSLLADIRKKGILQRLNDYLLLIFLLFTLLLAFISEGLQTSELVFVAFPMSVTIAKFLQKTKRKWLKETLLFLIILIPILRLVL